MGFAEAQRKWAALLGRWRTHHSAGAAADDLARLSPAVLAEIARHARLDREALHTVARRGPRAQELMERMLAAHDQSADRLRYHDPANLRDIAVNCSRCVNKGRCRVELDAGTARANASGFCPNASRFAAPS